MDMTDAVIIPQYQRGKFADWKYLIILDACRYDVFADICRERGWHAPLKVDTRCHCTAWWYRKYWSRVDNDVHLISANPVPFHKDMGWDAWRKFKSAIWADPAGRAVKERPELGAVLDLAEDRGHGVFEPVITLSIFEHVKQSGERYLTHLLPPHLPFLGPRGRALHDKLELAVDSHRGIYQGIQRHGRAGNWDEVRACYKENVEYALDALARYWHLFADGKTVITSDHGELTGDISPKDGKGVYHHSHDIKLHDLWMIQRTVPWFEIEEGQTWR
jgi:hypothetical protein